jgi:hypothetical protein
VEVEHSLFITNHCLEESPFTIHKKLVQSYFEYGELSGYRAKQFEHGTVDFMAPLVKVSENNPDDSGGMYLAKQEVIASP